MRRFISLTSPWRPSSSGERLLFLLLEHHQEWPILRGALDRTSLRLGRRFEDLADFFVGAALMNLMQRIIKIAGDVREKAEGRDRQLLMLQRRVDQEVGLSAPEYAGNPAAFFDEALRCAEMAARCRTTGALARQVCAPFGPDPIGCYSCDRLLNVEDENGRYLPMTLDHIWPAAMGGDTKVANLLPACEGCNEAKLHVALWQMAWIQPQVHSGSSQGALRSVPIGIKIALHMRAAIDYAHQNGTTLRDAYIAIGPRNTYVTKCDEDGTLDFFNMRVHDPERSGVDWMPR